MKLLVIPHAYSSHLVVREIELARCWARSHEVYVARPPVLNGARGLLDKLRFHAGALWTNIEPWPGGWHWLTMPGYYHLPALQGGVTSWAIRSVLKRFHFDAVINASYLGDAATPGCLGAEIPPGGYRYLYDLVDDHAGGCQLYGHPEEAERTDDVIRREIAKADHVIAVTPYLREVCRGRYGKDATVIPNGFQPPPMPVDEARTARLRAELGLHPGRVIGYIGSLDGWVDVDFMVRVLHQLRERDGTAQLLIVGGGERLSALRARYARVPGLIFSGWVPRERVEHYFRLIDLGLIPFAENALTHAALPIKALEYGAYGKPVLASALSGLRQLNLSWVTCKSMAVNDWCREINERLSRRSSPPTHKELAAYRWDALAKAIERLF
ncbi:MAG: glycosyltransferase [Deltaproteobacteria bacterium]|nr:glycosyltransferase [Deltaproteobacteria bacterium]